MTVRAAKFYATLSVLAATGEAASVGPLVESAPGGTPGDEAFAALATAMNEQSLATAGVLAAGVKRLEDSFFDGRDLEDN